MCKNPLKDPTYSSLLLQQCPQYLDHLCEIDGKWPYSCYFVRCCFVALFKIVRCILVYFPCRFFAKPFIKAQMVQPYNHTSTALKNYCFYMINNLSRTVQALSMRILKSLLVNVKLLPKYMNWSINFNVLPFNMEMMSSKLNYIKCV